VVDPDYLIERYGADTARLFCLFASPPEKDLDWSDQGVEGSYRFLQRVWRFVLERADSLRAVEPLTALDEGDREQTRLTFMIHKTIKRVSEDLERFHLNTAIAAIMELVNALYKFVEGGREDEASSRLVKGATNYVLILLSPFCPHITEELWQALGNEGRLINTAWPLYDPNYAQEDRVTIAVQINGKLRDTFEAERDLDEARLKEAALSLEKVKRHVDNRPIKKIITVSQ